MSKNNLKLEYSKIIATVYNSELGVVIPAMMHYQKPIEFFDDYLKNRINQLTDTFNSLKFNDEVESE